MKITHRLSSLSNSFSHHSHRRCDASRLCEPGTSSVSCTRLMPGSPRVLTSCLAQPRRINQRRDISERDRADCQSRLGKFDWRTEQVVAERGGDLDLAGWTGYLRGCNEYVCISCRTDPQVITGTDTVPALDFAGLGLYPGFDVAIPPDG